MTAKTTARRRASRRRIPPRQVLEEISADLAAPAAARVSAAKALLKLDRETAAAVAQLAKAAAPTKAEAEAADVTERAVRLLARRTIQ